MSTRVLVEGGRSLTVGRRCGRQSAQARGKHRPTSADGSPRQPLSTVRLQRLAPPRVHRLHAWRRARPRAAVPLPAEEVLCDLRGRHALLLGRVLLVASPPRAVQRLDRHAVLPHDDEMLRAHGVRQLHVRAQVGRLDERGVGAECGGPQLPQDGGALVRLLGGEAADDHVDLHAAAARPFGVRLLEAGEQTAQLDAHPRRHALARAALRAQPVVPPAAQEHAVPLHRQLQHEAGGELDAVEHQPCVQLDECVDWRAHRSGECEAFIECVECRERLRVGGRHPPRADERAQLVQLLRPPCVPHVLVQLSRAALGAELTLHQPRGHRRPVAHSLGGGLGERGDELAALRRQRGRAAHVEQRLEHRRVAQLKAHVGAVAALHVQLRHDLVAYDDELCD
mmetsp:Transcript_7753/g.19123  ORF Transcript_7753/g.19123 Transcript_7753/m.19123 type:complete len:396 (-) Transcript_7753:22-1209(-)